MDLTLHYAPGSNSCDRVRWALAYKRVPYRAIDVERPTDAGDSPRASLFSRVPVLEIDGHPLSESMAMLELLEEQWPERPLNYSEPLLRARVREVCEAVNASIHPMQNSSVLRRLRPEWSKADMRPFRATWIAGNLALMTPLLWREGAHAVGDRFTLADILVAAIYDKALALGTSPASLPRFEAHWQALMSDAAIRLACPMARAQGTWPPEAARGAGVGGQPVS